jgi:tyrosine-specific transport protein
MNNELKAYFIIVSTIIGLGIFALPYVFWHSGFYFIFWLFFLTLIFLILHLIFGEILLQTKEKHNLPGLVEIYIHPKFKHLVWFFDYFGMLGTFLIYFIVLAQFWLLIININPLFIKLIFALFNLYFIFKNLNIFIKMESILTILIFITFFSLISFMIPKINLENINLAFKNNLEPFLSYGVILFAISGLSSLPLVLDLIGRDKNKYFKVNFYALLTIFLFYIIYTFVTIGFIGEKISEESLKSLSPFLPKWFLIIAVILVTLNITFVDMAFYLKRGLIYDYKLSPNLANIILFFSILPLVFFEPFSLIKLISLVSEIFLGFNMLIICLIYLKLKDKIYFKFSNYLIWSLILIFLFGIIYGLLLQK